MIALLIVFGEQDSFLNMRQAVSQAIYSTISSPAYSEVVQLLQKASYYSPDIPVPTGGYPLVSTLADNDYLLKFKSKLEDGESPITFGFSDSLPEFRTVSANFARNISALLIAEYASDQEVANKAYSSFLDRFNTLVSSIPRDAFSSNPEVSVVFGAFPANIINQSLYGTHAIGAAWLRTGMSVGFRDGQQDLKQKYDDVVSGKASHSLCDIIAVAPQNPSTCTTGLLDLDFKNYITDVCGVNFDAFNVLDSWQLIDDNCSTIIGDVVQLKLIDGVTVFNETDIGSQFTVNYHVLTRNDIGNEKLGNYELISFLSYAINQNFISKRYSTSYRQYFGNLFSKTLSEAHNLELFDFATMTPGGALYDMLMQQKLFVICSERFALLQYDGVPFEIRVLQDALDYVGSIYGLSLRAIVTYQDLPKTEIIQQMLECTPESCNGSYYHIAVGFLERGTTEGLDYSDPLFSGTYTFFGVNLTTEQLEQLRTNDTIDIKFCYLRDEERYTSELEYEFVETYHVKSATAESVATYDDLFTTDCKFAYGPQEIGMQLMRSNSSFVMDTASDSYGEFSAVGKEDMVGTSNYVQQHEEIVYKRDSNMVYNGLEVVLSLSALLVVASTVVLIALN